MIRAYTADTRLNGRALQDAWLHKGDRISIGPIDLDVVELAEQIQEVQDLIESLENQCDELPVTAAPQLEVPAATLPAADSPTPESHKTDTALTDAKSKAEANSEPERAKRLMKSLRVLRKNRRAEEQAKSEVPSVAPNVLLTSELPAISLETIPSSFVEPIATRPVEIPSPSQIELPSTFDSLDLQQLHAEVSALESILPESPTFEPETLKETSVSQVADEISLVEVAQVASLPSSTPEQNSFSPPTEPEPWGLKLVAEVVNSEPESLSKPTLTPASQPEDQSRFERLPILSSFANPVDPTVGFHATDLRSFDTTQNYELPKYDVPKLDSPKFDVANYGAPTYEVASNFSIPVFENLKLVEKSNEVSLANPVAESESVQEPTTPPLPAPAFAAILDADVPFTDLKPEPVEPNTPAPIETVPSTFLLSESFAPRVETTTNSASSAELDLSSLYERAMQPVSASTFGSHSQAASNESANQIGSETPLVSAGWNLALLSANPETPAQTDQISDIYSAAINQLNSPSIPAESPDIAAAVESSTTSISSLLDSFTNSVESTNASPSVESQVTSGATGDQEVDRLRASLASLFEGLETRPTPSADSVPTTNSASESLSPTLNLQEPTLQLESTLPEAKADSASHQQLEPTPAHNAAPVARPEPTKPAASVGASESNEDDSVESYMARLLARVSGRNESSAPAASVQSSQPVATPRPTANPESVLRETFKQELAEREQEFKKPDYVPRVAAEAGIGLDKLREIANSSARSAVKVSQKKKSADSFMMSLTAAIICVIVGFILMKMSTGVSDPAFMGSLAAFAGGAFCGSRAMPKKKPAANK